MTPRANKLLDRIGWRIIAALQKDARMPFSALGRRVGLSGPAVAERVRRMEDAGIIAGYRVELGMAELGAPLLALIRVSAPEENCVPLGRLVEGLPHVLESHRVTGSDRLVIKVAVPNVAALDGILQAIASLGTATASVVLRSRTRPVEDPKEATPRVARSRSHREPINA
jgi:Lrp/AsnC family leucine-responsive transcriptional regulator